MKKDKVHWCDSCESYKTHDSIDHCKSLKHTIYPAEPKLKNELKIEFKKLGKNSGTTLEIKQNAKNKINELQELAGFTLTDWEEPENEIDSSLIKKLYHYLKSNIEGLVVSKDDSGQIFAKIETGDHIEILNLNSLKAVRWLMFNHKRMTDEFYNESVYKNTLEHIKADSQFDGSPTELIYNRICQKENKIYYDLCRPDWNFVRITKEGYLILEYAKSFPVFDRVSGTEQIIPDSLSKREDVLDELCKLFKIKDELLFKVHLIHFFFQDQETPFMFFDGEHGSVKTTITQMVKKTVDPTSINLGSFSIEKKDLQANISNKYLIAYDNVSGFDHTISDLLCRALSGDEISKRQHYTDNDLFVKSYSKKKFVFNGISPNIEFPDFNDRTIYYKTIHVSNKISKSVLWNRHDELLPHILHQIFNTIAKTFTTFDEIGAKIKPKSRLGDFEQYGETISQALGYAANEFLNLYYQKRREISVKDNDSWPILYVIDTFMQSNHKGMQSHEGLTSTLYKDLTNMAIASFSLDVKDKYSNWPKKTNFMSQQINKLKEQFRLNGYDIDVGIYTKRDKPDWHGRSVTTIIPLIKKESIISHLPSNHPDQTTLQAQNDENSGLGNGEGESNSSSRHTDHSSLPENTDSSHVNVIGEGGQDGKDNLTENSDNSLYSYWVCPVCHQDNPTLYKLEEYDSDNKSSEDHKRAGHELQLFTKIEASEFL